MRLLQLRDGADVALAELIRRRVLLALEKQELAEALLRMRAHVRDRGVRLQRALEDAEQRDAACERIGDRLEDERRRAGALYLHRGAALRRRRHALDEQVEERLRAEVLRRDAGRDREDLTARDSVLQRVRNLVDRELLALEVALHQALVRLHDRVEKLLAVLGDLGLELGRDRARSGLAVALGARVCGHVQEVDDARQLVLGADRQSDGDALWRELLGELAERTVEVGALTVEHVHEDDACEPTCLGPLPHAARADLDAHHRADDDERAVRDGQRSDRVTLEAGVARRVDEVDLPPLPLGVRERRRERHLPPLLVLVPVGDRVPRLDGSEPIDRT